VVIARELACTFSCADALSALIEEIQPCIVLNVGQAGGRTAISLERVALNLIDARIADNAGNQPIEQAIIAGGATAYFSNLPLKSIQHELNQHGIPAAISYSAGTYVCNYIFYQLMNYIHTHPRKMRGGFIHIPYLPQQATAFPNTASMGLETLVAGLRVIITAIVKNPHDQVTIGGEIC
jgi:pyroglutamyl-peptidase